MLLNIIYVLMWIWQCPQNIIGWLLTVKKKPDHLLPAGVGIYKIDMHWPMIVLGNYILVNKRAVSVEGWVRHSFGHFLQSFRLGPLYMPVIVIPGILWLLFCPKENYYMEFYTERWANKLARKQKRK